MNVLQKIKKYLTITHTWYSHIQSMIIRHFLTSTGKKNWTGWIEVISKEFWNFSKWFCRESTSCVTQNKLFFPRIFIDVLKSLLHMLHLSTYKEFSIFMGDFLLPRWLTGNKWELFGCGIKKISASFFVNRCFLQQFMKQFCYFRLIS